MQYIKTILVLNRRDPDVLRDPLNLKNLVVLHTKSGLYSVQL